MLQKLRALRTSENVLIAVDVLLHSKITFMNVFLMAFMIRTSLKDSPEDFIVYCLVRYILAAVLSIIFLRFIRRHTLAAWRMSMIFAVVRVLGVIFLDSSAPYFPFAVAALSAPESVFYWRPKMYFDTTEVNDDRRIRFKSVGQTWIELAKIVMPVVLGVAISASSYRQAGGIVLVISIFQLLLSFLFRPTKRQQQSDSHSLAEVVRFMFRHDSMHKIVHLSFLRGLVVTGAGYIMISQIHFYNNSESDVGLGIYTAIASAIAIFILWLYRRADHKKHVQKAILFGLIPPVILLPLATFLLPSSPLLATIFYVYTQAVVESVLNSTLTIARIQDILSRHLKDDSYRVEVESISEVFLSLGRAVSLLITLVFINCGSDGPLLLFSFVSSFAILPIVYLTLPSKMWRHDKIEA